MEITCSQTNKYNYSYANTYPNKHFHPNHRFFPYSQDIAGEKFKRSCSYQVGGMHIACRHMIRRRQLRWPPLVMNRFLLIIS